MRIPESTSQATLKNFINPYKSETQSQHIAGTQTFLPNLYRGDVSTAKHTAISIL